MIWEREMAAVQQDRVNMALVGAIVSVANLNVKVASRRAGGKHLIGGRKIGEAEEWYFEQMEPGDTFIFAGMGLEVERIKDLDLVVKASARATPAARPSRSTGWRRGPRSCGPVRRRRPGRRAHH